MIQIAILGMDLCMCCLNKCGIYCLCVNQTPFATRAHLEMAALNVSELWYIVISFRDQV